MPLSVRQMSSGDYEVIANLIQAETGEEVTAAALAHADQTRPAGARHLALVAESGGRVVGFVSVSERSWLPATALVGEGLVARTERNQGVGTALYEAIQPFLAQHRPTELRTNGSDDDAASLTWAERRGFVKGHHILSLRAELAHFDPLPFQPVLERCEALGLRFTTLDRIHSPAMERALHALYHASLADTPDGAEAVHRPFEAWWEWAYGKPESWPAGWVVALDATGRMAGMTLMQRWAPGSDGAHIFMTGVDREYRGKGVGLAMKVVAAQNARQQGVVKVSTITHWENAAMREVNRKLGYVQTSGFYRLIKRMSW